MPLTELNHYFIRANELETTVEMGDHSIFVGKVVEVGLAKSIDGRPDDATLWMRDLGDKVFYGG